MKRSRLIWSTGAALIVVLGLAYWYSNRTAIAPSGTESQVHLRLASWGGSLQDALDKEVIQPTATRVGLKATVETYSGEYDHLAATIRNNTNPFDIVHVETVFVKRGAAERLTLPIDWSVVHRDDFLESATDDYAVGALSWALVLAWNEDRLPKGSPRPSNWKDFFDLARFPGPRCVRKTPESNLEFALLADGVPPTAIYSETLDVQRALKKLETIKGSITWWSSGAELEQKLTAGCSLAAAWNGRVLNLKQTNHQPVAFTYDGAINQYDWWIIPANTQHKQEAMRFLAALGMGTGAAAIAQRFGYGPVAKRAMQSLGPDVLATIPSAPENMARGIVFNPDWWFRNDKTAVDQWNKWLIQP